MAPAYHTPTLESVSVTLSSQSPTSNGKILRYAFALEAVANVAAVATFLYFAEQAPAIAAAPRTTNAVVARLMSQPRKLGPVTPFTVETMAGFFAVLTVPIVLCLPNTRRAIESRPTVYATLLAGEVILIAQSILEITTNRNGLNPGICWQTIFSLFPFILWRSWVLWIHPEWFGSYKDATIKKA